MKRQPALAITSYLTIYLVWGSTYFFLRQAVLTVPPWWVLAARWLIGGALLLGFAAARGALKPLPSPRAVLSSVVLGSLLILGGNGLITVAEQHLDSYLAALLASSTPILVAVIDPLLLGKRLTFSRVLGVAFGFVGVAVLLYNGHSLAGSLNPSVLIGLAGVVSWSFATSLGHRFPVSGDNTVNSGIQMLFVGLVSLAAGLVTGPSPSTAVAHASTLSLVSVVYLGVLGSLAFAAYTWLVQAEPAERVVSYALVNPLIALFLGLALAAETPTPYLGVGVPVILVGLGFMLYGERLFAWLRGRARSGG
ncbi:MAG TPA: EamA family transporter [Spirochaetia bacterium]|nr:EamA family transporter [Spirochaetia bacterium]